MCGFAGFLDFSAGAADPAERRKVLAGMLERIGHRGPDDETFYDDGRLALGFCRLSIIDLDGGRQPLWNEARNVLAVVNGEIYNHQDLRRALGGSSRFRTRSDSEVIPHLYDQRGTGFLDPVNGIFATAVWDLRNRRLLLARDRLGVKPLYFAVAGGKLLFGSELKALLAHPDCPRDVDWRQVGAATAVHQPVTPSFVRGVFHLPAGHTLSAEPGKPLRMTPYWSLHDHLAEATDPAGRSPADFVEAFGTLFDDAVERQLMSDVPLGIFLSGGVDSTLIAAAASRRVSDVHCFTIAEPTTAMTGDLAQAERVAGRLGFPLHPVQMNGPGFLDELQFDLAYLEYMVWCLEEPYVPFEWFYKHELYRYAKTAMPDLKVILTGAGADEFAGGYSASYGHERSNWRAYLDDHVTPRWERFRDAEDALVDPTAQLALRKRDRAGRAGYQHMMYMNLWSLQFYNLWLEDRTSAAHGIEARVPFLDHRLVELLASVPREYFEKLFWDKSIVRAQLARLMPGYPLDYPKVPFISVPGNDSVKELEARMVRRIYPEFREKYLGRGETRVPDARFDTLLRSVEAGEDPDSATALYRSMQVGIFQWNCAEGWKIPPSIPASSPLKEAV